MLHDSSIPLFISKVQLHDWLYCIQLAMKGTIEPIYSVQCTCLWPVFNECFCLHEDEHEAAVHYLLLVLILNDAPGPDLSSSVQRDLCVINMFASHTLHTDRCPPCPGARRALACHWLTVGEELPGPAPEKEIIIELMWEDKLGLILA